MAQTKTLFETSWEVCNKVGGIHTVVSTKAKTLVERYGDEYVAIGPWLLANKEAGEPFEEEPGWVGFAEACRDMGVPVRVGRWRIPGSPRTILVEFSGLFERKDDILAELWESYSVDSITGGWDYDEPLLFGYAAGMVIERWLHETGRRSGVVAQFHEWMTGSGLLYLRKRQPWIGTVFTTHATMLGRALSGQGTEPEVALADRTAAELAEELGIRSKHSMETVCAREADVFTTVSEITAREAEAALGRQADPLLPNGIDLSVIDELAGEHGRDEARAKLADFVHRFTGEAPGDAAFLLLSGRYEFHNKGIDVLLEAMDEIRGREGRGIVLFLTVPAGQSSLCRSVRERLEGPVQDDWGPLGVSTHNLIDRDNDPIQQATSRLGLDNALGSRVKVIQIPIYLHGEDGIVDMPYEAVLRAMDLTCFPSFYEPWGYTPEESLAVGVPTVTTDFAGFGLWAAGEGLGPADGVYVLKRAGRSDEEVKTDLAGMIEAFLAEGIGRPDTVETCRRTAQRTAWSDLITHYDTAFQRAVEAAAGRAGAAVSPSFRPTVPVPVSSSSSGPRLFPFEVAATLPPALRGLERLARNYAWCWDPEGPELFEELSPRSWRASDHNPVAFLRQVYPEDVAAKTEDRAYVEKVERVVARFDEYMASATRQFALEGGGAISHEAPVAYLCAEFGVHESLRIYSGGLGILAGDHLKSASDIDLPLIAVGLFYQEGYLRQRVTPSGEQIELESLNDPRNLPMERVRNGNGDPLEIRLTLPSSELVLRAWRVEVGRVPLYLLDANVDANRPEDRAITAQLYGGDHEARLRQEIVLGRGGVRLLAAMGLQPSVWHMNEGHAAFAALERSSALVHDEGLTFDEARELVRATTVFTTHTPVPAGHDRFGEDLMRRYFSDVESWIGTSWTRFLGLGQLAGSGDFNMTYLAMSFAGYVNGVSKLHGEVSQDLLHEFWPGLLRSELPIASITNGVHLASWVSPTVGKLFASGEGAVRGDDFVEATRIDPEAVWEARKSGRRRLLEVARKNLERGFVERNDSPLVLTRMLEGLTEDALLIGFARRFAPYKRADLLFKDIARLSELLHRDDRPLRIFFAGKAHPRDEHGKQILKSVVELTRSEEFLGRVFFLEDYDIELGRALVQGVDVWLNNPIRTLEASGTSGMKVSANAGLNLSVSDGWWCEAYDGKNGWRIGDDRVYQNQELQDELDSANLCRLVSEELLPLFFERDSRGVPRRWLERVLHNLETIPPFFNTDRMVAEYRDEAYAGLATHSFTLSGERKRPLRELTAAHQRIQRAFKDVRIHAAHVSDLTSLEIGDRAEARVEVELGDLRPEDVLVELVFGHLLDDHEHDLHQPQAVALETADGRNFSGAATLERSGSFAYGIRVRPRERTRADQILRGLVLWA